MQSRNNKFKIDSHSNYNLKIKIFASKNINYLLIFLNSNNLEKCTYGIRYRSRSRLNFATYSTYVWTVPARRRWLSAERAADRRRRGRADGAGVIADSECGPIILGVENPARAGRSGRDSRRRRRRCRGRCCGSGRRCSCGRGRRDRRDRCGRSRCRGSIFQCFRHGMFPTYITIVAAIDPVAVIRCNTATAATLTYHIHEELGPRELADLRGAKGLMETWKWLLRDRFLLQLKSLA